MDGPEYGFPTIEAAEIVGRNDRFCAGLLTGRASGLARYVVVMRSIANHGEGFITEAFLAVARDSIFTPDSAPYGGHGFGTITVQDEKLFRKIDLYDRDLAYGSPDPDPPRPDRTAQAPPHPVTG